MWKCKKCKGNIKAAVNPNIFLYFDVDKEGKLGSYSYVYDSIEEEIRKNGVNNEIIYGCCKCGSQDNELEKIAIWEDK